MERESLAMGKSLARVGLLLSIITILLLPLATTTAVSSGAPPTQRFEPPYSPRLLNNPYMGMAPSALYGPYDRPHRLAYMLVTWRELEPERGKLAFEELEQRFHFQAWQERGVKLILRFVMDYSEDERVHKDIPDWLYEELNGDGIWYDAEVGKGFSPNYENPLLLERHQELMQRLGERYNGDPRIAFIALGSLGHWGEWHTYQGDDLYIPFPKLATSDQYVQHYLEAFPDKQLLMRRPHPIAREEGLGLFNDMFGSERATDDFVSWFGEGYESQLAGEFIPEMADFWQTAPSGGEFTNAGRLRMYFTEEGLSSIIEQARQSHTSWLGPSTPIDTTLDALEESRLEQFLKSLGYRYTIETAVLPVESEAGQSVPVNLTIRNEGIAPFYYEWPIELSLADAEGRIVSTFNTKEDLRRWLPGTTEAEQWLPIPPDLPAGTYSVSVAIVDPETEKPGVEFANEWRRSDGRYAVGKINIVPKGQLFVE
jgi:hypothetical protein